MVEARGKLKLAKRTAEPKRPRHQVHLVEHHVLLAYCRLTAADSGVKAKISIPEQAHVPACTHVDHAVGGGRESGERLRDDRRRPIHTSIRVDEHRLTGRYHRV